MRTPLRPLDRLRLRHTAWYVGTYAAVLAALGAGLFFVVAHQIGRELDDRLEAATRSVIAATRNGRADGEQLRMPGISLYVFDSTGHPMPPDTASALIRGIVRQARATGASTIQVASGKESELRARLSPFRSADGSMRMAVAAADLEDLEDRYALLITQFVVAACMALLVVTIGGVLLARKSAEPVEAAVEYMRRFMADAGHELRTPVTVLRTEAEVALDRPRAAGPDSITFRRMADEAASLASVVEDLFTLARAESAQLPVDRNPLFLDDVVSDAVTTVGSIAARKGVALSLDAYEEASVIGSATLLHRLLVILLDNAVKYTPAGGRVTVSVRLDGIHAIVDVTDTGGGITSTALPHVFDRFYRSDEGRAAAPGGGLGLSIARWIADAHGGDLAIASEGGAGTRVTLTLPRRVSPT
ncbi:MAG: HAMP domain-containing histidine kinase [Gemmatimonadota bacterium]|nr:HAMP domain-containing histidine kinase [Gemmatimonadota bacterium]